MNQEKLNELLKAFLVSKREQAGLSQSEVAARSDVFRMGRTLDQRAVSRIEQQPITADAIKIAGYLSAVGVQPQQYYDLLTELTYKEDGEIMGIKKIGSIVRKLNDAKHKVFTAKSIVVNANHDYIKPLNLVDSFEQIESLLNGLNRKPVIGCFGHFDAGKSTLINTVINQQLLPTKYQPATCVVNLLMHISDRPESITGVVALFKKGFKPHMIHDDVMVNKYLIEQGDVEILDRLGVHNYDEEIPNDAYIAIVFSAAEVLNKIWLLDTPGDLNSSDESDTEKALGGVELVDGVVFISSHIGFFKEGDLGFAANIIRQRPPINTNDSVSHLLFVQSHCHSEISIKDIKAAGEETIKRIKKRLDKLIFNAWQEDGYIQELPTPEEVTSRVQPFWRENDDFRSKTLKRIHDMADFLIANHETIVEHNIERALEQLVLIVKGAVSNLDGKKQDTLERVRRVEEQDARFRSKTGELVTKFKDLIGSCKTRKTSDLDSMKSYYQYNTSAEGLTELIEDIYSDNKEAQAEIGNYISQLLTAKLESILKSSGKMISMEVDELLSRWQEAAPNMCRAEIDANIGGVNIDVSAFNSRAAFIGGLAGLGSLGAMSLYVSTIASNLGAYILVGKAAGLLVSLGLVGSVTTVTSFVAAIGGPITIGIALAAAIGYLIYRLAGGSWQKGLAKKVAEAIRQEHVWDKVEKPISDFWDNTEKAISAGLDELITQTDTYISELKDDAKMDYDSAEIDPCISILESAVLAIDEVNYNQAA